MIEFSRSRKTIKEVPLTPLIDVVFILIIFFMLTTTFMQIESFEMTLPENQATMQTAAPSVAQIYIKDDGDIRYGKRKVDLAELKRTMHAIFGGNADQRVVVMVAEEVSLQTLVSVMDTVYITGGQNVFVREWKF